MIWIDLKSKYPTDTEVPGDIRWTQIKWDKWLAKSVQLLDQLQALEEAGQHQKRNEIIDANSSHWTKLKPWLSFLSDGKCWFSEAQELYSHYTIEHFRPKAQAKHLDNTERDGYWWLAFKYMNYRLLGTVGNSAKGTYFTLKEGSICSNFSTQCEEAEEPYLIDPIVFSDVLLVDFDPEGKFVAKPGSTQWEKKRVEHTARAFRLNEHVALSEERRKVWQRMDRLIDDFDTQLRMYKLGVPGAKMTLERVARDITCLTSRKAMLSSVARSCLVFHNATQLMRLIR